MSVINRMLLELEVRQHAAPPLHLPGTVRAVQPSLPATRNTRRWPLLVFVCALLLATGFVMWRTTLTPAAPSAVAQVEKTFRIAPPAAIAASTSHQTEGRIASPPPAQMRIATVPAIAPISHVKDAPAIAKSNTGTKQQTSPQSSLYLLPARDD